MDFSQMIMSDYLILIPFFYVIGRFLKQLNFHDNRLIPTTLAFLGIVFGILIAYANTEQPVDMTAIINGIIQGIFCSGMAVFGNETMKCLAEFTSVDK